MKPLKILLIAALLIAIHINAKAQVGVGIYTIGTAAGLSFKTSQTKKFYNELRFSNSGFVSGITNSTFTSELLGIYRIQFLDKVRFHTGLGIRFEWNSKQNEKYGAAIPLGVEAFPFAAIPNVALFFEVGPFYNTDFKKAYTAGLRTLSGVSYYFVSNNSKHQTK